MCFPKCTSVKRFELACQKKRYINMHYYYYYYNIMSVHDIFITSNEDHQLIFLNIEEKSRGCLYEMYQCRI